MTNNQFHILTYFCTLLIAVGVGAVVYALIRSSFNSLISNISNRLFMRSMKASFPCLIMLFAVCGFCSVNIRSCSTKSYEEIVKDRPALIQKNREQLSASIGNTIFVVLAFSALSIEAVVSRRKPLDAGTPARKAGCS